MKEKNKNEIDKLLNEQNKISEAYKLREEEKRKKQEEELNKIQKQIEDNEKKIIIF